MINKMCYNGFTWYEMKHLQIIEEKKIKASAPVYSAKI